MGLCGPWSTGYGRSGGMGPRVKSDCRASRLAARTAVWRALGMPGRGYACKSMHQGGGGGRCSFLGPEGQRGNGAGAGGEQDQSARGSVQTICLQAAHV